MEAADALQTFAEISVGVVGFSAVVVAISPTVVVRDGRRLSWGMAILFGWGLMVFYFLSELLAGRHRKPRNK